MLCAGARMRPESHLPLPLSSASYNPKLGSLLVINLNSFLTTSSMHLRDCGGCYHKWRSSIMAESLGFEVRQSQIHVLAPQCTRCLTLNKSLKISERLSSCRKWCKSQIFPGAWEVSRHFQGQDTKVWSELLSAITLQALPLSSCVALGNVFNLSESQFPVHKIGLIVIPVRTSWGGDY